MRALTARFGPALFLVVYFFWFAGGGLWARFTGDDLMNLNFHLTPSFGQLLLSNLTYWTTAYRPMGGIVYAIVYRLAGFHSMAFRVVCFALLLANLWLLYRVCLRLTERRAVALLATLLLTYHAWLVNLYYSTGTVYELFCFGFYLAAFDYYVGIRQSWAHAAMSAVALLPGALPLRAQFEGTRRHVTAVRPVLRVDLASVEG